ncbi:MAG: VCBS repeat-containing protein [Acidimicrobiaceae bacterium]|nr:VCBS repeat-containing protein [Acidimicrobiaceae bacterium]
MARSRLTSSGRRSPPAARGRIAIGGASFLLAVISAACLAPSHDGDKNGLDAAERTTPAPDTTAPTQTTTETPTTTHAPDTTAPTQTTTETPTTLAPDTTAPTQTTTETPTTTPAPDTTALTQTTTETPTTAALLDACAQSLGERVAPTIPLGEADIDGDGYDEELFTDDERREVWVRAAPDRFAAPTTLEYAQGLLDAVDLDGDGDEELFLDVGGNTAQWGVLLDWDADACALRAVEDPRPDHTGDWRFLHQAWGFSCVPIGCWMNIVCTMNDGIVEIVTSEAEPTEDSYARYLADPDQPPEDVEVWWYSATFRLDGELKILASEHGTGPFTDGFPIPRVRGVACSNWLRGREGAVP